MIRRVLLLAAAPFVAVLAVGPVLDRLARRITQAPRRLPEEAGLGPALDRLGADLLIAPARSFAWSDARASAFSEGR